MADFTNANANFTPSTTADNWVLDPSTNITYSKVRVITWGGQGVTSTGYRTRWFRPTTIASSTFTAVGAVNAATNPGLTPGVRFGTFATNSTPPADPGALHNVSWNVLGGGGIYALPIGGEWSIISVGTATVNGQIACRNAAGIDASLSSYGVQWQE